VADPCSCDRASRYMTAHFRNLHLSSWAFSILLLCLGGSPRDLAQVPSSSPFSFPASTVSKLISLQDAAGQLDTLQTAVGQVQRGKEPHFGTQLGDLAEKYHEAADALDKLKVSGKVSSHETASPMVKNGAIENLQMYIRALQDSEAKGVATRSRIDSDIALADRRHQAALKIADFYRKVMALPLPNYDTLYGPDYLDADKLALETSSYKTSLLRLRKQVDGEISSLKTQIASGTDVLQSPTAREIIRNIKTVDQVRSEKVATSNAAVIATKNKYEAGNAEGSHYNVQTDHTPPRAPGYNPYTRNPSQPSVPPTVGYPGSAPSGGCAPSGSVSVNPTGPPADAAVSTVVCP
jgi:hypothetical protein